MFPVAPGIACFWSVTSGAVAEASIHPDGASEEPLASRRLLVGRSRVHVVLLPAGRFKDGGGCRVNLKSGTDDAAFDVTANMADWGAPFVANVVRLLADYLAGALDLQDVTPLRRFLSLSTTWGVPCAFAQRFGDFTLAAFGMPPAAEACTYPVFFFDKGQLRSRTIRAFGLGDSTGFVWEGRSFPEMFVVSGEELVELSTTHALVDTDAGGRDWLGRLSQADRDRIMDAIDSEAEQVADDDGSHLDELFRTDIKVELGSWRIHGAVISPAQCLLFIQPLQPDAPAPSVSGRPIGGSPRDFDLFRCLTFKDQDSKARQPLFVYTAPLDAVRRGPVQVKVSGGERFETTWIQTVRAEGGGARPLLAKLIKQCRLDEDLISALHAPNTTAAQSSLAAPLPKAIMAGREPHEPILVCVASGDIQRLRETLIAAALTTLDFNPFIRVIFSGGGGDEIENATRELFERFGVSGDTIETGWAPLGDAISSLFATQGSSGFVLLRSGALPRRPDWWPRLARVLKKSRRAVCWSRPPDPSDLRVDDCIGKGKIDAIAFGAEARNGGVVGNSFMTFDGFALHSAILAARDRTLLQRPEMDFNAPRPTAPGLTEINQAAMDQVLLDTLPGPSTQRSSDEADAAREDAQIA